MVFFVDLEDDSTEPPDMSRMDISSTSWSNAGHGNWRDFHAGGENSTSQSHGDWREMLQTSEVPGASKRSNPNVNAITEALGCFPYVSLIPYLPLK